MRNIHFDICCLEKETPEPFTSMTSSQIDSEIEMFKANSTFLQSNIDDLNLEVSNDIRLF